MAAIRTHFIRSSGRQDFLSSRSDVKIELCDLLIVEKLVPSLHCAVGTSVSNSENKIFQRQLPVRIDQIRCERSTDGVHPMTSVTINVPPFPAVIDVLVRL